MKVMADILEQIVAHKRMELREMKRKLPLERLRQWWNASWPNRAAKELPR